jgi:hypothetical protein
VASFDPTALLVKSELQVHMTGTGACHTEIFIKNMEKHSIGVYYERKTKIIAKRLYFALHTLFSQ